MRPAICISCCASPTATTTPTNMIRSSRTAVRADWRRLFATGCELQQEKGNETGSTWIDDGARRRSERSRHRTNGDPVWKYDHGQLHQWRSRTDDCERVARPALQLHAARQYGS